MNKCFTLHFIKWKIV